MKTGSPVASSSRKNCKERVGEPEVLHSSTGDNRMTVKNGQLPKGWREVKLEELCSDIAYGYTATASNEPIGPKFLRITDIVSDSINWESVPYCEIEDSKKHRYKLETGDIVIARTGATTGYNQVIRSNEHSIFASYLIRYKLRQDIAYPFFHWLRSKVHILETLYRKNQSAFCTARSKCKRFCKFQDFLTYISRTKSHCVFAGKMGHGH